MSFIGRKKELKYLKERYNSKRPELIVIYGRRRLGKTSLLKKSLKETNHVYFLLTQENVKRNLLQFKEQLSISLKDPLINSIQADSWLRFFELAKDLFPKGFVIALDEFPYIAHQDKSILSQFQKIYDEVLKPKGIKLVLCGSSMSIMADIASYESPLYGRRTGTIKLDCFTFAETAEFFSGESIYNIIRYHLIFGGVPYYLEQVENKKSFESNIKELFFSGTGIFNDEISFLLKEDFKEVRNYLGIIKSISNGKNRFNEIVDASQMDKGAISKYLMNLEMLGIVSNIKSFFAKQNSKKSIYIVSDNYMYFWFRAIEKFYNQIENENVQRNILKLHIPSALGFLFERECLRIMKSKYEKVGPYFNKDIEIDILARNGNMIDCFECKFKKKINFNREIKLLREKMKILPDGFTYNPGIISLDKGIDLKNLLLISNN